MAALGRRQGRPIPLLLMPLGISPRSRRGPYAIVLLSLASAGALYQLIGARRSARRYLPPGTLVDVGGHRLHAVCAGRGMPPVVFESGIAASSLSWTRVLPGIATFTQACAYDRAGLAWSDVRPRIVRALHQDADVDARGLNVVISGNTVTLTGTVRSWHERESAERAAIHAPGITHVENLIAVEWSEEENARAQDEAC